MNQNDTERNIICRAIGERIRTARKEQGLTLDFLATRTGFSKSYLSQIENMKREPTIGTLTKIAQALGIDAMFLISGVQQGVDRADFALVRADERKVMPDAFRHKGHKYESLAFKMKDRLMDAYLVELGPDFPEGTKPWQGQEFVFALEGTHEFVYDGKSHIINEGDAYCYDARKIYKGRNIGSKSVKILVVFTSSEDTARRCKE